MNTFVEDRLHEALTSAATSRGALLLRGILVDVHVNTSLCTFLWIDRFGILAIDVQNWPGCSLGGTRKSAQWTARQRGAKRQKLRNPVLEADERKQVLLDAMNTCGRRIAPDYVQHVVVFSGADLSEVRLDPVDRARCLDVKQVDSYVRTREDFPPNPGVLEQHGIADLGSLFRTIDRSRDDEAVRRHEATRSGAKRRKTRGEAQVAVSDSVAGVAPVAIRISDRYPDVGGERSRRSLLPVLMAILLVLVAVWVFGFNGQEVVVTYASELLSGTGLIEPTASPQSRTVTNIGASVTTEEAMQVLHESAPDLVGAVTNMNSPTVTVSDGNSSFTWVYEDANSGPVPHTITLTFDASGQLRGVGQ